MRIHSVARAFPYNRAVTSVRVGRPVLAVLATLVSVGVAALVWFTLLQPGTPTAA